ncbi:hypothetical protein FOL47_005463 [Perkinsus chesapeaki]|uniref:Uncharacterized protein n=1 Tax=Perkinsus chesapeaki TaxID=330153 RepID=A0A7J6LYT9_PERCH|nr:hypothetical protein FOL47_005463 [Perkinsus chesapeaki]
MLSSVSNCITLLLIIAKFGLRDSRFPAIPEVASEPNMCLHKNVSGPYCWYILRDNRQVNGGLRLLSNGTGAHTFSSIELSAGLDSEGHPNGIGVWANRDVSYESLLIGNIKLKITLHIPLYCKGGSAFKDGWELYFPASVTSLVTVPYVGDVTAKNESVSAHAVVYKNNRKTSSLVLRGRTAAHTSYLESMAELTVMISSEDLITWHYEANVSIDVAGKKDGYNVHYVHPGLLIFLGSLRGKS